MAVEWGEVPAYRDRSPRLSARRRGAAFIADVERRADELHPAARRLFANWLELAEDGGLRVRSAECTFLFSRRL